MVIKVFILLQERSLVTNTHERVSEEKIRKGSAGLFYSSPSRASFLPSLQGYQFVYRLMVIQKRQANAPLTPRLYVANAPMMTL